MATKLTHKIIHGTIKVIEDSIYELEKDGWELITVVSDHHSHGKYTAFFKRIPGWFEK